MFNIKNKAASTILSLHLLPKSRAFMSGGHMVEHQVKGRLKVKDHIVWVNVVGLEGVPRRLPGWEGQNLLDLLKLYNLSIPGDCKGGDPELKPSQVPYDYYSYGVGCSQCQVVIADPWYDKIKMYPNEEKYITRSENGCTPNSRLSCCIDIKPYMNEMIVTLANNQAHEGEPFNNN